MFLPTEGLYAEALRRPGLVEGLQREHKVMLTGPTTLLATLTSLQMGFRTLALEKRSSEVWETLGAVKTEFGKFGAALANTRKKLQEASKTIDDAEVRTRAMERSLRKVEALPDPRAQGMLPGLLDDDDGAAMAEVAPAPADAAPRAPAMPTAGPCSRSSAARSRLHSCMAGIRMASPLAVLREGHAAWAVGVLLGLFAAAPIVLALRAGRLADRHGYHLPIRVAVGLTVAGGACAVLSTYLGQASFVVLCIAATLHRRRRQRRPDRDPARRRPDGARLHRAQAHLQLARPRAGARRTWSARCSPAC